jgi:hypothetical protein
MKRSFVKNRVSETAACGLADAIASSLREAHQCVHHGHDAHARSFVGLRKQGRSFAELLTGRQRRR